MYPVRFKLRHYIVCAVLLVPYLMMLLLTILAVLNLSGCSSDSDPNTPSAVNYTEQGWRHYKSGNYAPGTAQF